MTGRPGYDSRPERQNEYFVPGDGISREVIQADICRYLGNDALVRPGNHNGRPGFFIRAYRNLTSEMIADLKNDSARWEADVVRRTDQGYPRGSYFHNDYQMQDYHIPPQAPNKLPASYAPPPQSMHEARPPSGPGPGPGPSPPPTYSAPPPQPPYMDPYAQNPYGAAQSPPYPAPSSYTAPQSHSPFSAGQTPFPQQQQMPPFSASTQPAVSADIHPSYTYTTSGYGYESGRTTAPRYPGAGYDTEMEYSPITTGIVYPTTTAPDPRIPGMDSRFTPESTYSAGSRQQPANNRRPR